MKEPLGLPRGSVRSVIALLFSATTSYLFATGQAIPNELMLLVGVVVTFYFKTRSDEQPVQELPEPYVGEPA